MQKWEYLRIHSEQYGTTDDLNKILNELGGAGWEMTAVASGDTSYTHFLYFKRPKP